MDPVYRVEFFKNLLNSTGQQFAPCQGMVEVHAPTAERAVQLAQAMFAREQHVPAWNFRADYTTVSLQARRKPSLHRKAADRLVRR